MLLFIYNFTLLTILTRVFFLYFFLFIAALWHMKFPGLGWTSSQLAATPYPQQNEQGQRSNLHPHRHYVMFLTCWATTWTPPNAVLTILIFSHLICTQLIIILTILIFSRLILLIKQFWGKIWKNKQT